MKYTGLLAARSSGSAGGITASHNRGGQYYRARTTPTNPSTARRNAVKSNFGNNSTYWVNTLTNAQRDAWNSYALAVPIVDSLGEPRNAGGLGMFQRTNTLRLQAGLAVLATAPTTYSLASLTAPTIVSLTASSGVLSVGFTNTDTWATVVGGRLMVFISRPQNVSINSFRGPFAYAGSISGGTTPPTSPMPVTSPFTYTAAQKAFVRFVAVNADGRVSPDFLLSGTAV